MTQMTENLHQHMCCPRCVLKAGISKLPQKHTTVSFTQSSSVMKTEDSMRKRERTMGGLGGVLLADVCAVNEVWESSCFLWAVNLGWGWHKMHTACTLRVWFVFKNKPDRIQTQLRWHQHPTLPSPAGWGTACPITLSQVLNSWLPDEPADKTQGTQFSIVLESQASIN